MPTTKSKTVKPIVSPVLAEAVPVPPPKNRRRLSPIAKIIGYALAGIISLAIVSVIVIVSGSYLGRWHSPIIKTVAAAVPYPALVVNGHWLAYNDFLGTVAALEQSYSQPGALQASGLTTKPTRVDLEELVLDRMVKDQIVKELAEKRGVSIDQTTLDAAMKDVIDQTGSEADVKQRINELYGWDLATFAKRVVEPFLYRQRLQEKIAFDDQLNATQKAIIDAILIRVRAGKEDFSAIASEVNEDATKDLKGDYGIFASGERDQVVEDAVFALKVGETSGVVRTAQGFHILKLLEKIPADAKAGTPEKVHASHIFLGAKQLDTWLFEQSGSQKVTVMVSGFRWDTTKAAVVSTALKTANSNVNTGVSSNTNSNVNATSNVNR